MYQDKSLLAPINQKLIYRKLDTCPVPQQVAESIPGTWHQLNQCFLSIPREDFNYRQRGQDSTLPPCGAATEPVTQRWDWHLASKASLTLIPGSNCHTKSSPTALSPWGGLFHPGKVSLPLPFFPSLFSFPPFRCPSHLFSPCFPSCTTLSLNSVDLFLFLSLFPSSESSLPPFPSSFLSCLGIQDRRVRNWTCVLYVLRLGRAAMEN